MFSQDQRRVRRTDTLAAFFALPLSLLGSLFLTLFFYLVLLLSVFLLVTLFSFLFFA